MCFFGLFRAKMTKIGIQNSKQQLLAHFDLFLSIFQISDVKPELLPVKLKVHKNGIFWAKNIFQKKFPRLFVSPQKSYATQDVFQMLPQVGLINLIQGTVDFV